MADIDNGTNGNGTKINGGVLGTCYRIIKEFGFAVVVAGALFWMVVQKDVTIKELTNRSIVSLENNTKALTELTAAVKR